MRGKRERNRRWKPSSFHMWSPKPTLSASFPHSSFLSSSNVASTFHFPNSPLAPKSSSTGPHLLLNVIILTNVLLETIYSQVLYKTHLLYPLSEHFHLPLQQVSLPSPSNACFYPGTLPHPDQPPLSTLSRVL